MTHPVHLSYQQTEMNSNKFYEDYQKLKIVGQGSFGTATLYRRTSDGKQVVVKEVYLLDMDMNERKTALNEAEILATLNHPNIIKYCGNFQRDGSLFIVMEYADGGNLTQLINAKRHQNSTIAEKSVLNILSQISNALAYMHANKILHRDLKSANIFLNMNGTVQVGDFGIAKMLRTKSQAQTVVGTPYYLSPEMCEGSDYNEKSDVWAMGCILYELACLRKPFEAPTLPVLVQKIITCDYSEIPDNYSDDLSQLVHSILQKSPNLRPSAKYVHDLIPKIVKKNMAEIWDFEATSTSLNLGTIRERSILYKLYDFGDDQKIIPLELPHKMVIHFSIGYNHQIVVTSDHAVYTWGENTYGQLGLNEILSRTSATLVKSLQNAQISKCAAGKNVSLFLSNSGHVYSCGDGRQGCLGHGDWESLKHPKIIEWLKTEKITEISCGDEHVIALSNDGKVYTWGSSKNGQLGQGHTQYRCGPLLIKLLHFTKIRNIFCGENESVLLTTNGQVLVSGKNNHNKLGIRDKNVIPLFTPVVFKEKIKFASIGTNHTTLLTENGNVMVLGQFGKVKINPTQPHMLKLIHKITNVASGPNFTVAVDDRNVLWFWGSMKSRRMCPSIVQTANSVKNMENDGFLYEFVTRPRSILAFFASQTNVKSGNIIYVGDIKVKSNCLYVLAHTTCPPPVKQFNDSDLNYRTSVSVSQMGTTAAPTLTNLPNMV